jgi:hypothetical protein
MGLLILFGRIRDRVGLPTARVKTPNLPAMEAGTPVLSSPYPTTKASCQFLPGGLEKIPHILGSFFEILLPLCYIRLTLKQVLIIYFDLSKAISYQNPMSAGWTSKLNIEPSLSSRASGCGIKQTLKKGISL